MSTKELLTDKRIQALRPAPAGSRYVIWDAGQPHLGVRVTDRAVKDDRGRERAASVSFIVMRRLPGEPHPLRHTIGQYHPKTMPLAKARNEARRVLELITSGTTPKEEAARQARENTERRANTVGAVAGDYVKEHVAKLRNAREVEAIIRRELLGQRLGDDGEWVAGEDPIWRNRPITEVTEREAAALIKAIKNRGEPPAPGQRRRKTGGEWAAHHALEQGRAFFNWAIAQKAYGLVGSPFGDLDSDAIIGEKKKRKRVLNDAELRIIWRAAVGQGYPHGDLVRTLMLCGQRRDDIAELSRPELDLGAELVSIPPERMKMDAAHEVPLSKMAAEVLRSLPLPKDKDRAGDFIFSTTAGAKPFSGFSKAKAELDEKVAEFAAQEGITVAHWTLHDLRRTFRTRLSALRVPYEVAELCIAHRRKELDEIYDQHAYREEKREAMERWAARLNSILNPPPDNVVRMADRAAAQ